MLIPLDVIRRDIVRVADTLDNPAIKLIEDIALYAQAIEYDVSLEETLRRHQGKVDEKHEFGEKQMREWWLEHDTLNTVNEVLIPGSFTEDQVLKLIAKTIMGSNKDESRLRS